MNAEYYGWLGAKGYDTVIKIEDYDAYVYRTVEQKFVKNNDFLKRNGTLAVSLKLLLKKKQIRLSIGLKRLKK